MKFIKQLEQLIDKWCYNNNIKYYSIYNESNLYGAMIFNKNLITISKLISIINKEIPNLYIETKSSRGGVILAISETSITEILLRKLLMIGEKYIKPSEFENRIEFAFSNATPSLSIKESKNQKQLDFKKEANKLLQSDSLKIKQYNYLNKHFQLGLNEALEGIATQTGNQPSDLFSKFSNALAVLGKQMGVGPLQYKLKEQGINWKKSEDGQAIILFVNNAETKAPQPIARISSETLDKPNEFEAQLFSMIDFARGDAPGAFKQKQAEIQSQEKAVREIAKAVSPPDQNSTTAQLTQPTQVQAPVQPQQPAPQQPMAQPNQNQVGKMAAKTAGMPKTTY